MPVNRRVVASWLSIAGFVLAVHSWSAQNPSTEPDNSRLLEVVVTTATKKSETEAAQDVPVAMSVLGGEELAVRRVTDLEDLSYAMPNVALDGIGTGKGIANFSIRGIGVAGSIPSIDPTVGVFVDGVYLGVSYGVIMDMMDLEAVEVLRGPQGLLFGRNVTGGAVLFRSRRPSGEASAQSPRASRRAWTNASPAASRRRSRMAGWMRGCPRAIGTTTAGSKTMHRAAVRWVPSPPGCSDRW